MQSILEDNEVERIARKVVEYLRPTLYNERQTQSDEILDVKGLCEYLKVTPKWVYEQSHLGAIPRIPLTGKTLRFSKRKIAAWLEEKSQPATSEPTGSKGFLSLSYRDKINAANN